MSFLPLLPNRSHLYLSKAALQDGINGLCRNESILLCVNCQAVMSAAATIERKEEIDRHCGVCGKPSTSKCSLCKSAYYCSKACQKRDWKSHKNVCKNSGSNGRKSKNATNKKNHTKIRLAAAESEPSSRQSPLVMPWKMEDFPDGIIVHIAIQAAKLCSLRDYVRFAQTSKRIHKLWRRADHGSLTARSQEIDRRLHLGSH